MKRESGEKSNLVLSFILVLVFKEHITMEPWGHVRYRYMFKKALNDYFQVMLLNFHVILKPHNHFKKSVKSQELVNLIKC